jgi:hypothetical protein
MPQDKSWTVTIGGDDSWDTMRRVLDALAGWHAEYDGCLVEIRGAGDGFALFAPVDGGEPFSVAAQDLDRITTL